MCKPFKMGWADKKKPKDRQSQVISEMEMKECKNAKNRVDNTIEQL